MMIPNRCKMCTLAGLITTIALFILLERKHSDSDKERLFSVDEVVQRWIPSVSVGMAVSLLVYSGSTDNHNFGSLMSFSGPSSWLGQKATSGVLSKRTPAARELLHGDFFGQDNV